jgi:AraC-like DNA-binding protein
MKAKRAPAFFAKEVTGARRFFRDLAASSVGALKVVTGGVEQCGAAYLINRVSFPFPTIEYVARGHGDLVIADRTYELGPGSVFAYKKGVPHRISARGQMLKYFVAFTGTESLRLLKSGGVEPGGITRITPADALTGLFEELVWAGTRADPSSADYCRKILECLAMRLQAATTRTDESEPVPLRKYHHCRETIEAEYLSLHSAKQIAARCRISAVYLSHLFQRYDHQTPYRLLTRLKMNHAAALIQQSDMLVKQAAEAVGYADQFHFSRVFREFLGVPPSEWRRMNASPDA